MQLTESLLYGDHRERIKWSLQCSQGCCLLLLLPFNDIVQGLDVRLQRFQSFCRVFVVDLWQQLLNLAIRFLDFCLIVLLCGVREHCKCELLDLQEKAVLDVPVAPSSTATVPACSRTRPDSLAGL